MFTIKSTFGFEAAHRLYDVATYSKECRDNVHGHSYYVTVIVGRNSLNDAGMVMDFKLFKKILKESIEDVYDHSCILKSTDPLCKPMLEYCGKVNIVEDNPTAEWMAKTYFNLVQQELLKFDNELKVVSLSVQETKNNIATYTGEN